MDKKKLTSALRDAVQGEVPKKSKRERVKTSLYLDQELIKEFKDRCEKDRMSMSQVLEALVRKYLGKNP